MSDWISSGACAPSSHDDVRYQELFCRKDRKRRIRWLIRRIGLLVVLLTLPLPQAVIARDNGQYAGTSPELKAWFDSLRSGKGPCCSDADGSAVSDVDWESNAGHYRVRLDGVWVDVPDEAVITTPNRVGRTMVWPIRLESGVLIRCFMPGSMT
jgi:hypothetical protein